MCQRRRSQPRLAYFVLEARCHRHVPAPALPAAHERNDDAGAQLLDEVPEIDVDRNALVVQHAAFEHELLVFVTFALPAQRGARHPLAPKALGGRLVHTREEQPRMLGEFLRTLGRPVTAQIFGRCDGNGASAAVGPQHESRIVAKLAVEHRKVGLVGCGELLERELAVEHEFESGRALRIGAQHGPEKEAREIGRGREPHDERIRLAAKTPLEPDEGFDVRPHLRRNFRSRIGGKHRTPRPIEERAPELALELEQKPRHLRDLQVEFQRRLRDAPRSHRTLKDAPGQDVLRNVHALSFAVLCPGFAPAMRAAENSLLFRSLWPHWAVPGFGTNPP